MKRLIISILLLFVFSSGAHASMLGSWGFMSAANYGTCHGEITFYQTSPFHGIIEGKDACIVTDGMCFLIHPLIEGTWEEDETSPGHIRISLPGVAIFQMIYNDLNPYIAYAMVISGSGTEVLSMLKSTPLAAAEKSFYNYYACPNQPILY